MPNTPRLPPDGSVHRAFCRSLRTLRTRYGLTCADVAARVNYTAALIAKVEEGTRTPGESLLADLDTLYETDGLLTQLWCDVTEARERARAGADVDRLTVTQLLATIGLGSSITATGLRELRGRLEVDAAHVQLSGVTSARLESILACTAGDA